MSGLCDCPSCVCGADGGAMAAERINYKKREYCGRWVRANMPPPPSLNTRGFNWLFIVGFFPGGRYGECPCLGLASLTEQLPLGAVWKTVFWRLLQPFGVKPACQSEPPSLVTGEKWTEIGYSGSVCPDAGPGAKEEYGTRNNTTLEPSRRGTEYPSHA